MPRITSIEAQRRGGRVTVFADGAPWVAVQRSVAVEHGLRRGVEATAELQRQLQAADARDRAYEAALLLLSYRQRAAGELRDRLHRKGLPEEAVEEALARLGRAGLIDDAGFARAWVESRGQGASALGRRRLQLELRRKGVAADTVAEALGEGDDEAQALAAALGRARALAGLPYPDFRRRLSGFLQRRGFGYEAVAHAVRESWRSVGAAEAEQSEE